MKNKTALITGASTGIGYELSKLFARDGHDLVLVARNRDRLAQIATRLEKEHGISARYHACDLAKPDAASSLFSELASTPVEYLVNNAGSSVYGLFQQNDLEKQLQIIQLNLVSLTSLTRLFLTEMLQRKSGRIMNIGSTGSFVPGPLNAVYCATKAYVLSFSEALDEELQGSGVSVTTLCPGMTMTEFHQRAAQEKTRLYHIAPMEAAPVALAGYRAMMSGKRLEIPGLQNKMVAFLPRLFPRPFVTRASRYFMSEA